MDDLNTDKNFCTTRVRLFSEYSLLLKYGRKFDIFEEKLTLRSLVALRHIKFKI